MAAEQHANRAPIMSLRPDQALVGVPVSENGEEVTHFFAEEDDKLLRKQQINAQNLPDYQVVRRHLGPGGLFIRTEPNGWLAVGVGLSKHPE